MRKKLNDVRGETLVEVLVSVLIGALSVTMLFSMVMVSVNLNRGAKAADESLATDLRDAEVRGTEVDTSMITPAPHVTVKNKDTDSVAMPSVKFYGGDNTISYALPTPALTPGGTP